MIYPYSREQYVPKDKKIKRHIEYLEYYKAKWANDEYRYHAIQDLIDYWKTQL